MQTLPTVRLLGTEAHLTGSHDMRWVHAYVAVALAAALAQ